MASVIRPITAQRGNDRFGRHVGARALGGERVNAFVGFCGDTASDDERQRSDGRATLIAQLFVLEIVTRNVRSLKTGSAARNGGGVLALQVFKAAVGARLPSAASPLAFIPGPGPTFRNGMQYLPLLVQADLLITK